jgi:hypothetical protein
MGKLILSFVFAMTFGFVYAQVPNPDFENWDSIANYENPEGWTSSNEFSSNVGPASVVKDTGYTGNYSAKISTVYLGFSGLPYVGILSNGNVSSLGDSVWGGSPITVIPDSIHFAYKYTSADSGAHARFIALFFRNTNGDANRDTVAVASFIIPQLSTFLPTQVPVFLSDTVNRTVDSVLLVFFSSNNFSSPDDGSLWIDDITFGGPLGIIEASKEDIAIDIFPNPVNDYFVVRAADGGAIRAVTLLTLDGRRVRYMENLEQPDVMKVSTDRLEKGIYVVSLEMADGNIARRMVTVVR